MMLRFAQALLITFFFGLWGQCCCPVGTTTRFTARSPPTRVAPIIRVGMGPLNGLFAAAHRPFPPTKQGEKPNCLSLA